jgi:hypothetical protein
MKMERLLQWTLLLLSFVQSTLGHPQCLDFRPPFENSEPLLFCSEYSDFGCCSASRDYDLQVHYKALEQGVPEGCKENLRELLCQECSPYSIHIFDAERSGSSNSTFPGLCIAYCRELLASCSSLVPLITQDPSYINALSSEETFCSIVQLPDQEYCYPELLTDPRLNGELKRETRSEAGCLCLEEFASNLANPLIFRTAVDDERIFVGEQLGKVYIYYHNGSKLPDPFLDLQDLVLTSSREGDERGFLGLALHPDFPTNQRLFVYFSISGEGREKIRISEFKVSVENRNQVNRSSERVLLEVGEPWWNHNGGEVRVRLMRTDLVYNVGLFSRFSLALMATYTLSSVTEGARVIP